MRNKIIYLVLGMTLLISPLRAQISLETYLSEAGQNNPEVQALFSQYLSILEKIPQVKALPDPQVALAYFLQPIETRMGPQQVKLSVSQFFPWFGILSSAEQEIAELAKAQLELFEEAKSRLYHDVRSVYYELFFSHQALRITEESLKILQSFERLVLVRIENGQSSSLAEIRLQIEMGDLRNQLSLLEDRRDQQWLEFDNLISSPGFGRPEMPEDLIIGELSLNKADIWNSIKNKNHLLLKTDFELSALQARQEKSELEGMPDFNLGLDYIAIGKGALDLPGKDAWVLPKIGVSIPLYRDKYKAKVKEVVYQAEAKSFMKDSQINKLETGLESIYNSYRDALRRIELFTAQSVLARQGLKIIETEFANSSSPFEEVLRMERKLLGYSLELAKAQRDKGMAVSYIDYLMGL